MKVCLSSFSLNWTFKCLSSSCNSLCLLTLSLFLRVRANTGYIVFIGCFWLHQFRHLTISFRFMVKIVSEFPGNGIAFCNLCLYLFRKCRYIFRWWKIPRGRNLRCWNTSVFYPVSSVYASSNWYLVNEKCCGGQ